MKRSWFDVAKWSTVGGMVGGLLGAVLDTSCAEQVTSYSDWVILIAAAAGAGAAGLSTAIRKK